MDRKLMGYVGADKQFAQFSTPNTAFGRKCVVKCIVEKKQFMFIIHYI